MFSKIFGKKSNFVKIWGKKPVFFQNFQEKMKGCVAVYVFWMSQNLLPILLSWESALSPEHFLLLYFVLYDKSNFCAWGPPGNCKEIFCLRSIWSFYGSTDLTVLMTNITFFFKISRVIRKIRSAFWEPQKIGFWLRSLSKPVLNALKIGSFDAEFFSLPESIHNLVDIFNFFYWLTRNITSIELFSSKFAFFQSYENMVCTSAPERFFYWIRNLVCSIWWDYFQLQIRCLAGDFCSNTQFFQSF